MGTPGFRDTPAVGLADFGLAIALTLVLLAAVYGVLWWLRRRGLVPSAGTTTEDRPRVVAETRVGTHTRLLVVEAEGRRLLLTESTRNVTLQELGTSTAGVAADEDAQR